MTLSFFRKARIPAVFSITAGFFLAVLFLASPAAAAQTQDIERANYDLAARWTSQKVAKMVLDTSVSPRWLATGDRFWYSFETDSGRSFFLVDPSRKTKTPIFDNAKMAAMLMQITLFPYDAQNLPIKTLKFVKNDTAVRFDIEMPREAMVAAPGKAVKTVDELLGEQQQEKKDEDADKTNDKDKDAKTKKLYFEYTLATGQLFLLEDFVEPPKRPRWVQISPDEKTVVFARNHNLYLMDADSYALALKKADDVAVKETQITTDGIEHYSYARTLREEDKKELQKDEKDREDFRSPAVTVFWSHDSKKFALIRTDERKVSDLWVINHMAQPRPTLETYRYAMPGEKDMPQPEILVYDSTPGSWTKIKADQFKDQTLSIATAPASVFDRELDERPGPRWLSETPDTLYFSRLSRDLKKLDICVADPGTGDVRVLIEERLNTYIETKPLRLAAGGREIIHWSERDGWGHFYLYTADGKLKNRITTGEFSCQSLEGIDEKTRTAYIAAAGREPGDPYYMRLYRVGLDGTGLKLLTPEDASHSANMVDSARFFVNTYSRIDTAPKSVLRDAQGNLLLELETADLTRLKAEGFVFPEPFAVKAADGITDLYGAMHKPFDFDPGRSYPIIAYVYPGPQTEGVTKTFSPRNQNVALAQFGFIVIEVGNRGGHPHRSKWYHNYGYGNLRDYGLADKKVTIEQLAARHPFIDINRVGIYGHSGGGFMSTAAMLVYPDFFKVAVSSAGNHENNIYNRWWSEKHHGVKEVVDKDGNITFEYAIDKNSELAANLKGRLLLTTGDMDNNVHPANTYRMAAALIKANKRFDFFIFPGQRHGFGDMNDYFSWIRADYFCRHLIGDSRTEVDLIELQREQERGGSRRGR